MSIVLTPFSAEPTTGLSLRVAQIVEATEAEGPGRRFAIWLQGCPLRCAGCCNPEMLPFVGGQSLAVDELAERILGAPVDGVTFLGGEPFAQASAAATLAERVRAAGLTVMVFSGFTLEEIQNDTVPTAESAPSARRLLRHCDLLVDGRYERDQPDVERRWIGSRNQRMHFLSERYRREDATFYEANTVELRLSRVAGRDQLVVNGWPELAAQLLAPGRGKRR